MFRKLHNRFGTAGLIVAVVALVVALTGTAFAAAGLSGTQKKEVTKIAQKEAKKFAGKPGAKGDVGAAGPAGPAGAKGDTGAPGTVGVAGSAGKSVVLGTAPGSECPEGGVSVGVEGSSAEEFICNGAEGPPGQPWTAGGTLPSGATETGVWSVSLQPGAASMQPISFTLPLAAGPEPVLVEGASAAGCPGIESNGTPKAAAGKLCLYQHNVTSGTTGEETGFIKPFSAGAPLELGAAPSGTILNFECEGGGSLCVRVGTWAVTAP